MTIEAAKHRVSHPDRDLACQETVEDAPKEIIEDANTKGWGTIETISAMEEVLRNLRLVYAEDLDLTEDKTTAFASTEPDPSNDWPAAET